MLSCWAWRPLKDCFCGDSDRPRSEEEGQGVPASVLPYLAFGPALALELLLFQNIAQQTALMGWPQPAVYAWVLGANLAGVAAAVELARSDRPLPWPVLALLGGLLVSIAWGEHSGVVAALVVLVGHVVIAALLASVVKGALKSPARPSTDSASVWVSAGMTLMLLLLFIYYASYDTDVLAPKEAVRPLAALLVGLAALWARAARRSGGVSATSIARIASVPALLLLLLPLLQLAAWKDVTPTAGTGFPRSRDDLQPSPRVSMSTDDMAWRRWPRLSRPKTRTSLRCKRCLGAGS